MSQNNNNDQNTLYAPAAYQAFPFWKTLLKDLILMIVGISFFGFILALIPLFLIRGCVALGDAGLGGSVDSVDIVETFIDGNKEADAKVVVLPIEGVILSDTADGSSFWSTALRDIMEDDTVQALVLRTDTPGGTVAGSAYYHRLIKKLKEEKDIPIIVSMGDLTCSGGYYISMAADELIAEPSTVTGSIGVICALVNAAELCKKLGVSSNAITSGSMKAMGSFMKEPTEEENAIWQALVDSSYEQFLSVIRDGRPWFRAEDVEPEEKQKREEELRKIADGRIYTADQALELHLIDQIGYLDDAIDVALERAELDKDAARVVVYAEPEGLLQILGLGVRANEKPLDKASSIIETFATPKTYYLCPNALPL
ncbi:MAG: signal peptide peptidase SppA [Thermoguttaceae bacterium]|jgi:protease-4